jgi:cytochrome c oxidase cbb3-type subunit IV
VLKAEEFRMKLDHDAVVAFSKSWGLFYLIAFVLAVLVYTFWPSNRKRFDRAKKSILDRDDKPWK